MTRIQVSLDSMLSREDVVVFCSAIRLDVVAAVVVSVFVISAVVFDKVEPRIVDVVGFVVVVKTIVEVRCVSTH